MESGKTRSSDCNQNTAVRFWAALIITLFSFTASAQTDTACDTLITTGIAKMFEQQYGSAIEYLSKAQETAKRKNLYRQEFLAINNLGLTYYKMLDYGNAIAYYLKAYELALKNNAPTDEMIVLNNIALLYIKDKNFSQAEEYFKKSYDIALKNNIQSRVGIYASNLAQLNLELKRTDIATKYVNEAIANLDEDPKNKLNAFVTKNNILIETGRFKEAIPDCLSLLEQAKKKNYTEAVTELETLLAIAYTKSKEWPKAAFYVEEALKSCTDDEMRIKVLEQQSVIAFNMNNIRKLVAAKDSILTLTNLINKNKNKELLEYSKLRFELSESKHDLRINKALVASSRKLYFTITAFLILLVSILIWAFYKRTEMARQKRIIAENNLKIIDLELEKEKNNSSILKKELKEKELLAALEQERQKEKEFLLQQEIQQKNKQISDKILFQSTRNELIEEIIESIPNLPNITHNEALIQTIHNLKSHLKEDSKWEEFTASFENINNDFINRLKTKHPSLTANDIRFLSFVYLNLSNKEIASLLHISPESCRKRKERITKKLAIDPDISLFKFLSAL